jgi:hypothetical protein
MKATRKIYLRAAERAELYGVTDHERSWSDRDAGYPDRCCLSGHVLMAAFGRTSSNDYNIFEVLEPIDNNLTRLFGNESSHEFSARSDRFAVAHKLREIADTLD